MGLADVFKEEEKIPIRYSDLCELIEAKAERQFLRNAVTAEIPYGQVLKMLTGANDDLEAYRETGLTPDQIRTIDHEYSDLAKEKAVLKASFDALAEENRKLREKLSFLEQEQPEEQPEPEKEPDPQLEPEKKAEATPATGLKMPEKRNKIDAGRVMALRAAGWGVKQIAADMGLKPNVVSQVIYRENKKAEAQNDI